MRAHVLSLLLLFAAAPPAALQAAERGAATVGTLRLSQVRGASDEQLVRLVLGPLASFPYPTLREGLENRRPYEEVELWFYSEARAGGHAGVCRTQRLIVSLETLSDGGSDPRLRPAGFELDDVFIVENEHEARGGGEGTARDRRALDAACRALDPRRDGTPAEYATQLLRAIELTEQVGGEARAGRLSVPIVCRPFFVDAPADEAACVALVAGFGRNHVRGVSTCRPRRETAGGCIRVQTDRLWLEYDVTPGQRLARVVIEQVEPIEDIS